MQTQNNNKSQPRIRINYQIRIPQIRVVDNDGTNLGVMDTRAALRMAQEQSLDLVEINPRAVPPVCKIMDYGKFKYDEKKKLQAARRNQQIQELKEITFRPNTDENDLTHKVESAKKFLEEGDKVKFTIRFRGREITHPQVGKDKLDWILQQLDGLIVANPQVNLEGKFMSMIVSPIKK